MPATAPALVVSGLGATEESASSTAVRVRRNEFYQFLTIYKDENRTNMLHNFSFQNDEHRRSQSHYKQATKNSQYVIKKCTKFDKIMRID